MEAETGFFKIKPEQWRPKDSTDLVNESRARSWQNFLHRGLPSPSQESWHYTDLRKYLNSNPQAVLAEEPTLHVVDPLVQWQGAVVVFIDGHYCAAKSRLPKGIEVVSLSEVLNHGLNDFSVDELLSQMQALAERASEEHGGLLDLQQALLGGGSILRVAEDTVVEPVKLEMFWSASSQARLGTMTNMLWLGERSKLTLFEENQTTDNLALTLWTHLDLAADSHLEYVRLQKSESEAVSLSLLTAEQQRGSEFSAVSLVTGGKLSRDTWVVDQVGESATTRFKTLQLGDGKTQIDLRSVINHQVANGISEQRARTVAADHSRVVFSGKIVIAKDAQLVSSSQLTQGLLLGEQAEIDSRPQLEIYADNVKANHGATVGQMDEEELFYLQSRGLTRAEAQRMLGQAFARDVIGKISDGDLRLSLDKWLSLQLNSLIKIGMTL